MIFFSFKVSLKFKKIKLSNEINFSCVLTHDENKLIDTT